MNTYSNYLDRKNIISQKKEVLVPYREVHNSRRSNGKPLQVKRDIFKKYKNLGKDHLNIKKRYNIYYGKNNVKIVKEVPYTCMSTETRLLIVKKDSLNP